MTQSIQEWAHSPEGLIYQAARMGWINDGAIFPHPTVDCPCLSQVGELFLAQPEIEDFRPLVAARLAEGPTNIHDMLQLALEFLEPKYKPDLSFQQIEDIVEETPVYPEILKIALAVQLLEEAWGEGIFDWYNIVPNQEVH